MEYSLKIFIKTKKKARIQKQWDIIAWIFIVIWFSALYYMKDDENSNRIILYPDVFVGIILVFMGIFFLLHFSAYFRYEELLGVFDGRIVFKGNLIKIKDKEISIDDIKKLEIWGDDYVGNGLVNERGNVNGCISQGVGNLLFVKMKNGKEIEVNFLQTKKNQIREMEPLLIHYCQKGIIHRLHFMSVLGLGYDEIQVYKKKYGI